MKYLNHGRWRYCQTDKLTKEIHKQRALENTPSLTNCAYVKNDAAECDDKFLLQHNTLKIQTAGCFKSTLTNVAVNSEQTAEQEKWLRNMPKMQL